MAALLPALFVAVALAVIGLSLWRLAPQGALAHARIGLGALLAAGAAAALAARQPAVGLGLAALAWACLRPLLAARRGAPTAGGRSEVRTDALAMTLDHDTGEMDGEVLSGRFAGRRLSALAPDELAALLEEWEGDEETAALILAFLDRRGEHAPGGADAQGGGPDTAHGGGMGEAEALRVLGLAPGASREEVRAAHRRLIRKVHPDLGGSPALAALINAAKERLDPG